MVDENVYVPAEDSFLLAENIVVKEGEQILDMGAGCGLQSVIAARNANVVAVDINPHAIQCAKINVALNGVQSRINFLQCDLFTAFSERAKFDMILFNPPYLPVSESEANAWIERAWTGGATGRTIIDRFIRNASKHLKPRGHILLVQSNLACIEETLSKFSEHGFKANVIADVNLPFFETVALIKAECSQVI